MALTDYAGLQASIAGWLMGRDDLAAVIPDFIALAEDDMSKRLRLRSMLKSAAVDSTTGELPADCLAVKSASIDGRGNLEFATLNELATWDLADRGGQPTYWGIDGNQLVVSPTQASGTVAIRYYARVPALSDAAPVNQILAAHPAIYLYGSLLQAAPYLLEDARVQTWGQLYEQAAGLAQGSDDAAEYPGPLVIKASQW